MDQITRTDDRTRPGVAPLDVVSCANDRGEAEAAVRWLVARHASGIAWRDLLVVAPGKRKWSALLAPALASTDIPYRMLLGDPGALPRADDDVVHVASLYGAEGLAFPHVAVIGLGDLPWKQQADDEAMRIAMAACAIATHELLVTRSRPSAFADRLLASFPATSRGSDARTRD